MVAIIKTGHSIRRILNYNENKVKEGVAACIMALNYPLDNDRLSFNQKLNRLVKQVALNENVTRHSVHISLNFDPAETISNERLKAIAETYMQRIGFDEQPCLVYQHFDAGHPHIHIVSIKVRADGSRIDTQNIGRNQSEKARKEIEENFGLIKAISTKLQKHFEIKSAYAHKVQYGKSQSRKAIANVLDTVLNTYKYTSVPELNAILRQYNIQADRGNEGSRIYQHRGLIYRIVDEKGSAVGVPIKASLFHNKPTLKYLEERFSNNDIARQPHKSRIKNAIDLSLLKHPKQSLENLIKALNKESIHTVLRQNAKGITYGVTYVDHQTKCVYNGSALGKQYSANGLLERYNKTQQSSNESHETFRYSSVQMILPQEQLSPAITVQSKMDVDLLETLLQPEHISAYVPNQLTANGKKKRKKRLSKRL